MIDLWLRQSPAVLPPEAAIHAPGGAVEELGAFLFPTRLYDAEAKHGGEVVTRTEGLPGQSGN
jgi:hypothetical protein